MTKEPIDIARVCHEANKAYCVSIGDNTQLSWDEAEQWQKDSAITGVTFILNDPNAPDSATHDSWLKQKVDDGWAYGPTKDPTAKTHPCIMPYEQLPEEQQKKDALFSAIVNALR